MTNRSCAEPIYCYISWHDERLKCDSGNIIARVNHSPRCMAGKLIKYRLICAEFGLKQSPNGTVKMSEKIPMKYALTVFVSDTAVWNSLPTWLGGRGGVGSRAGPLPIWPGRGREGQGVCSLPYWPRGLWGEGCALLTWPGGRARWEGAGPLPTWPCGVGGGGAGRSPTNLTLGR